MLNNSKELNLHGQIMYLKMELIFLKFIFNLIAFIISIQAISMDYQSIYQLNDLAIHFYINLN